MTIKQWLKIQSNRAKMVAYLLRELPKMMAAIGFTGYADSRGLQKWIQNHITQLIPTDIDDEIIKFDQEFEDRYIAPYLKQWAEQYANDVRNDHYIDSLKLENQMIKQDAEISNKTKTAKLIQKALREQNPVLKFKAQLKDVKEQLQQAKEREENKIAKQKLQEEVYQSRPFGFKEEKQSEEEAYP